jgi:NAD(P)-dependent dehydrogenase (short-subunit alcohol dehydrogenase family)
VVNNAGYANSAAVEDMTLADFREQVDTNLFGVVNVTKAALPVLREQGGGHIVQISSVGGRVTTPGLSAYQAAKFAVGGFSEVLAAEVGPLGIKVTVLEPGGMRTDWAGSSMAVHPVSPAYEQTVGHVNSLRENLMSKAASDIAKVADVLLTVVDLDEPPVRLLLGSDAVTYAGRVEAARAESDARWRELSVSTDYDDITDENIDPLATLRR